MSPKWTLPGSRRARRGYVNVQALPDRIVEGKVTRTSWVLGANRTLRTELDLPNPNGLLRPGMYATAHILLQERPDVYVLPLVGDCSRGQASLLLGRPRTAGRRECRLPLGLQVGNDVEVVSGLKGDELVVQSQAGFTPGRPARRGGAAGRSLRDFGLRSSVLA